MAPSSSFGHGENGELDDGDRGRFCAPADKPTEKAEKLIFLSFSSLLWQKEMEASHRTHPPHSKALLLRTVRRGLEADVDGALRQTFCTAACSHKLASLGREQGSNVEAISWFGAWTRREGAERNFNTSHARVETGWRARSRSARATGRRDLFFGPCKEKGKGAELEVTNRTLLRCSFRKSTRWLWPGFPASESHDRLPLSQSSPFVEINFMSKPRQISRVDCRQKYNTRIHRPHRSQKDVRLSKSRPRARSRR